jgi:hypothetical protein
VLRVGLLSLAGLALGAGLSLVLLWLTREALRGQTAPKVFEVEHYVVYLTVILGAGFGAVCGALAGLASVLARRGEARRPAPTPAVARARPERR